MATCKQCCNEFAPKKTGQVFCNAKHKAAWHRDQIYKDGVEVTVVQTRHNKKSLSVTVRVGNDDREKLARMAVPGCQLIMIGGYRRLKSIMTANADSLHHMILEYAKIENGGTSDVVTASREVTHNALAQGPGGSSPGPAGATSWPAADEAEKK